MTRPHLRRVLVIIVFVLTAAAAGFTSVAAIDLEVEPGSAASRSNLATAYLLFDAVFIDGDRETANALIADDAVVHSDRGTVVGASGVFAYLDVLGRADAVERVDISVDGDAITIRWELQLESGTHYGRTLATVDHGTITELWMLNESDLATAEGGSFTVSTPVLEAAEVATTPCPPACA
jgi:hypothetical protein